MLEKEQFFKKLFKNDKNICTSEEEFYKLMKKAKSKDEIIFIEE